MARSSSSEPWADGFLPKSLRPGQLIGDSGIMIRGTFVIRKGLWNTFKGKGLFEEWWKHVVIKGLATGFLGVAR